ncbi:hypothetical protein GCM10023331_05810 [Algivirga pacifica]|uniref:YD repeat-containing protein n=2 Tax=Algivirga pacifica TaxID=1162670 RepID=A0ABP9D180_9BACT
MDSTVNTKYFYDSHHNLKEIQGDRYISNSYLINDTSITTTHRYSQSTTFDYLMHDKGYIITYLFDTTNFHSETKFYTDRNRTRQFINSESLTKNNKEYLLSNVHLKKREGWFTTDTLYLNKFCIDSTTIEVRSATPIDTIEEVLDSGRCQVTLNCDDNTTLSIRDYGNYYSIYRSLRSHKKLTKERLEGLKMDRLFYKQLFMDNTFSHFLDELSNKYQDNNYEIVDSTFNSIIKSTLALNDIHNSNNWNPLFNRSSHSIILNDNGHMIKEVHASGSNTTYEYVYDQNHNWVIKRKFVNGDLQEVVERNIHY